MNITCDETQGYNTNKKPLSKFENKRLTFSQVRQTGDVAEWLPPKSLAMHRNNKNAVPLTFLEQFQSIELPTVRTDYLCKHV